MLLNSLNRLQPRAQFSLGWVGDGLVMNFHGTTKELLVHLSPALPWTLSSFEAVINSPTTGLPTCAGTPVPGRRYVGQVEACTYRI